MTHIDDIYRTNHTDDSYIEQIHREMTYTE